MTTRRPAPNTGSTFRERLGVYLVGVALGCLILGMFWSARKRAAQQQAQPASPPVAPMPATPPANP